MKKKRITVLSKPSIPEQELIVFSYLNYLCISKSTVLDYLRLQPSKEDEAETKKSTVALA